MSTALIRALVKSASEDQLENTDGAKLLDSHPLSSYKVHFENQPKSAEDILALRILCDFDAIGEFNLAQQLTLLLDFNRAYCCNLNLIELKSLISEKLSREDAVKVIVFAIEKHKQRENLAFQVQQESLVFQALCQRYNYSLNLYQKIEGVKCKKIIEEDKEYGINSITILQDEAEPPKCSLFCSPDDPLSVWYKNRGKKGHTKAFEIQTQGDLEKKVRAETKSLQEETYEDLRVPTLDASYYDPAKFSTCFHLEEENKKSLKQDLTIGTISLVTKGYGRWQIINALQYTSFKSFVALNMIWGAPFIALIAGGLRFGGGFIFSLYRAHQAVKASPHETTFGAEFKKSFKGTITESAKISAKFGMVYVGWAVATAGAKALGLLAVGAAGWQVLLGIVLVAVATILAFALANFILDTVPKIKQRMSARKKLSTVEGAPLRAGLEGATWSGTEFANVAGVASSVVDIAVVSGFTSLMFVVGGALDALRKGKFKKPQLDIKAKDYIQEVINKKVEFVLKAKEKINISQVREDLYRDIMSIAVLYGSQKQYKTYWQTAEQLFKLQLLRYYICSLNPLETEVGPNLKMESTVDQSIIAPRVKQFCSYYRGNGIGKTRSLRFFDQVQQAQVGKENKENIKSLLGTIDKEYCRVTENYFVAASSAA